MKPSTLLLLVALAIAPAWSTAATPGMAGENALRMFVGRWQSHGSLTTPGTKKHTHITGANDCEWSSNMHLFLVCNGVAHVEGMAAPQYQLSIYTFDPASKRYRFAGVTTNRDAAVPDFALKGNTWSYSGKFTDKVGKTHWFRTLNIFDSPDRYRFEIQSSEDGEHWTTTGSGVSIRA